ncbi:MAG: hypothetical protein NVV63_14495 [Opitutus sp.]|nr:hypothetical protein [Opitutus sp.]
MLVGNAGGARALLGFGDRFSRFVETNDTAACADEGRRVHAVGAPQRRILTTKNESIYALFRGADEGAAVVAFLNLTKENAHADAYDPALAGRWRDLFTGEVVDIVRTFPVELEAGAYRVLVRVESRP